MIRNPRKQMTQCFASDRAQSVMRWEQEKFLVEMTFKLKLAREKAFQEKKIIDSKLLR